MSRPICVFCLCDFAQCCYTCWVRARLLSCARSQLLLLLLFILFSAVSVIRFGCGDREWRVALAAKLGDGKEEGNWFSTQTAGNCDDEGQRCFWRIVENIKIANATCVNGRITDLVEGAGKSCFAKCDDKAALGDCYTTCFMTTFLGDAKATPPIASIPTDKVLQIFNNAFASDDVSKGGCPSLPPWQPTHSKQMAWHSEAQ